MESSQIFLMVWALVMSYLISTFFIKGRKSLKQFPELQKSDFEYIEKSASGYSNKSVQTKMGGAKNALRISVTKDELWLTSNVMFASILDRFDLLHRIPINTIRSVEKEGKNINLIFEKSDELKDVVILSRKQDELFGLLKKKIPH